MEVTPTPRGSTAPVPGPSRVADEARPFYIKIVLISYAVWTVLYLTVGGLSSALPSVDLSLAADSSIPFLPHFIWIYFLCYGLPLAFVYLTKDWHRFNVAFLSLILCHVVAYTCFLNIPVSFPRPEIHHKALEGLFFLIYSAEGTLGGNNFPSLHVVIALSIVVGSCRQQLGAVIEGLLWVLALLITLSTLFTKQHILVDVACAILLVGACWPLAHRLYQRHVPSSLSPPAALLHLMRRLRRWVVYVLIVIVTATIAHWWLAGF